MIQLTFSSKAADYPERYGAASMGAIGCSYFARSGGAPLMEVFENTRLRLSDMTKDAQIPWNSQGVDTDFLFFQQSRRRARARQRRDEAGAAKAR